jgi:hypothetical protein
MVVSFIGGGNRRKPQTVASHWQTLSHNVVHLALNGMIEIRYDNVTLSPLLLQRGLRFGPIQRNVEAPGVIHTGRFFVLIPLKWLGKLTGVKDKYI